MCFSQDTVDGEKQNIHECGCHSDRKDATKEILFNPNVFTEFKLAGNPEVAYLVFRNFLLLIRNSIKTFTFPGDSCR